MPSLNPYLHCPGPLDRRSWLKIGGLSMGALAGGVEPSLSRLFAAESETSLVDPDYSVILFWANGGPSHLDLFDLKPNAPAEYRGPFKPIATNVPGIEITEELPMLAQLADKFSLVRSLHHERNEHSGGTHRLLTGYASRAANLNVSEYPDIGSIVYKHVSHTASDIPLYVADTKFYGGGPGYLGPSYWAYMPSPYSSSATGSNTYEPVAIYNSGKGNDVLKISPEGILTLQRRSQLRSAIDRLPNEIDKTGMMDAVDGNQQRAIALLSSPRTREAFDLERETEAKRLRYGETHWGRSLLTCRRLVEAGSRFVQCQASYRLKKETGRTSNWDDHSVNSHIFNAYREKLPSFDQSVSALIEDIYARGLDQKVLFIFCGEFGRTPKIRNQDASGRPGRDHWSHAMSILLAGGGLKMGQVIGATNDKAEHPVERVMNSNCLLATIYHQFGIDTTQSYLDLSGRPIPILTDGKPIAELI
ncbi:MAG: DUF1501 domain-containing protein [Planctomycetota bacterium]|nr:DUF1501 domain-containing protein [Planctomycetota bacterium]